MADVAKMVGISKNAVSLALSGRAGVSEETRREVVRVASELGYPVRSRPTGTTRIALAAAQGLFHQPSSDFFGPLLEAVQQDLSQLGYTLSLFVITPEDEAALQIPRSVADGEYSGIVVVSKLSASLLAKLYACGPLVLVDHYDPGLACDQVLTENEVGAHLAVHHLVHLGHRAIGFIGQNSEAPSYVERWRGFRIALERSGLEKNPDWIWQEAQMTALALGAFYDGLTEPPTAWFCVNDVLAMVLVNHLRARNVDIPGQVAVVGFDGLELSLTTNPQLTTVNVDHRYYAHRVAEVLHRRIENPGAPFETIRVIPRLVVRGSTAQLAQVPGG